MINRDSIKALAVAAVCFTGMVMLFGVIFDLPARSQQFLDPTPKDKGYNFDEIADQIKDPYPHYEQYADRVDKLPEFEPPADNHLTEEQIHKYYQVIMHCWSRISEFKKVYVDHPESGFGKALLLFGSGDVIVKLCQVEGLDKAKMREEEFDFVRYEIFKAALFAVNVQLAQPGLSSETTDALLSARVQLSQMQGLDPPADPWKPPNKKFDASQIPRHNIALVIKFKDEVRHRRTNFKNVRFDYEAIMKAAQAQGLPE